MRRYRMRNVTEETGTIEGFYVYKHVFSNGKVYIGKGKGSRYCDFRGRSEYWKRNYRKHGSPSLYIAEADMEEDEAFELEEFCIREHLDAGYALGKDLVNFTIGGGGISGYTHSDSDKQKISEASKALWKDEEYRRNHIEKLKAYHKTEEAFKVKSDATKRLWENEEYRKNKVEGFKKMWQDPEHIEAMRKRSLGKNNPAARTANIYRYPSGELIAENVVSAEWARDNGYSRPKLQITSRSDRTKPSTATNPHHHKKVYMEYTDGK